MAIKIGRWSLLWVLLFFLFVSRFGSLGFKPFHHDESIHAVESWKYALYGTYKFNPMLHGPFLYHYIAGIFEIAPVNNFTARAPIAAMGVLLLFAGLVFFRKSPKSRWLWAGLIGLSPIACYYSRTLIMDIPMALFAVSLVACAFLYWQTERLRFFYGGSILFALMLCTKLNSVIYAFSFVTFFPVLWIYHRETFWDLIKRAVKLRWHWLGAMVIIAAIFALLYSSLGRNYPGILDGLYRKMIPYWAEQHRIRRIKGPYDYYIPILVTYELPLVIGMLWSIHRAAIVSIKKWTTWLILFAVPTLSYVVLKSQWPTIGPFFQEHFQLDAPLHPVLVLLEIGAWILLVRYHLLRNQIFFAFLAHWAMASLGIYSYAGEKVPWLTTHLLIPWVLYLAAYVPTLVRETWPGRIPRRLGIAAIALMFGWQGFITYRICFPQAADPRERLVFTHTTMEISDLVDRIEKAAHETGSGAHFKIQTMGNAAWPLYWYLRNYKSWYRHNLAPDEHPAIVIHDWDQRDEVRKILGEGYDLERRPLRAWWVPDESKVSWKGLVKYYFTRETYNPIGSQDIAVFTRKH